MNGGVTMLIKLCTRLFQLNHISELDVSTPKILTH